MEWIRGRGKKTEITQPDGVYSVYVPPTKPYLFPYVALFKSVNFFSLTRLVESKPL